MNRLFAVIVSVSIALPSLAPAVEISSKAKKITITGRVQPQFRHSTVEGEPSNEFLIRRARATVKVKINDWWSGVVQPDFAGNEISLKDAYVKAELNDNVAFTMGQAKRPFDLFELTSSTRILIIERDGRVGGNTKVPSLSALTEGLGYADRDIGFFGTFNDSDERFTLDVGVTNGDGAGKDATRSEKAYQGRIAVQPIADQHLTLAGGISVKPYDAGTMTAEDIQYASAFEGSIEYGKWSEGPHVQAGVIVGDNWEGDFVDSAMFDVANVPSFLAVQGIATYKHALEGNAWFEAIEPLVRVGFADPNTDVDDDGGILVTPGVNLFTKGRNRFSVNVDVFVPQASDIDTEASLKAQSWLYW